MRILAIDPGNEESAWCLIEGGKPTYFGKRENAEVRDILSAADAECYAHLAIEMISSYGMPVGREVFETCLWIGRFAETWERHGGTVKFIYRKDVKMHLCGNTRAKDANVRQALIDHYGPGKDRAIGKKATPGPLYGFKGDEWAALAVALTAGATVAECSAGR
jgi:hypothetical protein